MRRQDPLSIRKSSIILSVALAGALSCRSDGQEESPVPQPDLRPAPESIDEAVQRRLEDAGLEVTLAGDTELCRRIFADLVGRFPTSGEVVTTCAGQEPETIALGLQGMEEYAVRGQRRWRDRIASSDALLMWRDEMPAFDVIAQMLRGELDYEEFAIELMAEPGLMALDIDPESRAYRVHRVFLGGDATEAMAQDLARLTRIWDRRMVLGDGETFGKIIQEVPFAYIVPGLCGPLGACRTDLHIGGSIEFPNPGPRPFRGIKYQLLSDAQKLSLRGLGEHVVTLPRFWEAPADEVLERLLGWNDGGTEPRLPGRVLPEVRALVVEHLQETKDIQSAERLIIGSLLYRQSNRGVEDRAELESSTGENSDEMSGTRPIWASGPLKFTPAEVLLNTVRGSGLAEGSCDPRTSDDAIYQQHLTGLFDRLGEDDTLDSYNEYITEFHQTQGNWRPLVQQEVSYPIDPGRTTTALHLDPTYFSAARAFGGCPGTTSPRLTALDGLTYAFGQEVAANLVCGWPALTSTVGGATGSAALTSTLMSRLFSRAPNADEFALFDHVACDDAACSDAELAQGICVSLLGAHEMLFY